MSRERRITDDYSLLDHYDNDHNDDSFDFSAALRSDPATATLTAKSTTTATHRGASPLELADLLNLEQPFEPFSLHGYPGKHSLGQVEQARMGSDGLATGSVGSGRQGHGRQALLSTHTTTQYYLHGQPHSSAASGVSAAHLDENVLESLFDRLSQLESQALVQQEQLGKMAKRVDELEREKRAVQHQHKQQQQQQQQQPPREQSPVADSAEEASQVAGEDEAAATVETALDEAFKVKDPSTTEPFAPARTPLSPEELVSAQADTPGPVIAAAPEPIPGPTPAFNPSPSPLPQQQRPSTFRFGPASRAVRIGNIHASTTFAMLHRVIRCGPVEQIFFTPGQGYAVAWYLHPRAAELYLTWVNEHDVMLDGKCLTFARHETQLATTPPSRHLLDAASRGCSTTLWLDEPRLTLNEVHADCSRLGNVIDVNRLRSGTIRIVFGSMHDALEAIMALKRMRSYRGARIQFARDECGEEADSSRFLLQHSRPKQTTTSSASSVKDGPAETQPIQTVAQTKEEAKEQDAARSNTTHLIAAEGLLQQNVTGTSPAKQTTAMQQEPKATLDTAQKRTAAAALETPTTPLPKRRAKQPVVEPTEIIVQSDGVQRPNTAGSTEAKETDQAALPKVPCKICGLRHWRSGLHRTPCRMRGDLALRR
ncbi:hypothetical protein BCR37DRAFT_394668 [Protomyces lactucae-debilis]|uniref:RRM domain-containing protein n=1 Tax=Protomyces lactucae-debilis TaxID=2754530 RepID=A0A1Y2F2P6_PROLT|nr:uncharacterized protein BCR37DRAFT_394668 [Protomyces lactucae-debilis]ORY78160.1 hypothetical protein BCR37DRAFT_394668 [Protomyces lactucae-debilis]